MQQEVDTVDAADDAMTEYYNAGNRRLEIIAVIALLQVLFANGLPDEDAIAVAPDGTIWSGFTADGWPWQIWKINGSIRIHESLLVN